MANDLTNLLPKVLAMGLLSLRRQALLPQMVNADYGTEAKQKGDVINVPGPVSGAVRDVTPSHLPASSQDLTPGNIQITLNQWKEFPFFLTDKDRVQIDSQKGFIPMAVSEGMKQIANTADSYVHSFYKDVYGFVGTAGTTPFTSAAVDYPSNEAIKARTALNNQLAPVNDRRLILNPDAEGMALSVPAIADVEKTGDQGPKIEGMLGKKYGFQWGMSQSIGSHTKGTAGTIVVTASTAVGASTIGLAASTPGTILIGDIFTLANSTQTYVSLTSANLVSTAATNIDIRPAVVSTIAGGTALTLKNSHVVNLAFTPGCFTFATRPLADANSDANELGSRVVMATDPVSGLSLRLEVTRQHKQTNWSFDHLYGGRCVRPDFGVRVAG